MRSLALLRAIRAANVPRLVFSSTGSMYVGDGTVAFETAEVRPQSTCPGGRREA
jgi:UDP-glucose 4-epimerase